MYELVVNFYFPVNWKYFKPVTVAQFENLSALKRLVLRLLSVLNRLKLRGDFFAKANIITKVESSTQKSAVHSHELRSNSQFQKCSLPISCGSYHNLVPFFATRI